MSGFGKDPTNPFTNNLASPSEHRNNRQAPFFEFALTGWCWTQPTLRIPWLPLTSWRFRGYLDSLGDATGNGADQLLCLFQRLRQRRL